MPSLEQTQVDDSVSGNQEPHEPEPHEQHGHQGACALKYRARLFCEERAALVLCEAPVLPSILTKELECGRNLTRWTDLSFA